MRSSRAPLSRDLALGGLLLLLTLAFLLAPPLMAGATAPSGVPATPLVPALHPATPLLPGTLENGTTAVDTSDANVANNEGANFTLHLASAVTLALGESFSLTLSDPISLGTHGLNISSVGLNATFTGTTTATAAEAVLPNGTTIVDHTLVLPTTGDIVFRMEYGHGYWWTFTTFGGHPITGALGWQNGTYNLGAAVAIGYASLGPFTLSPELSLKEEAPALPLASSALAGGLTPCMDVNASGTPYQPTNGLYVAPRTAAYGTPLAGEDQLAGFIGPDVVILSPPIDGTTTNGIALWGTGPVETQPAHTWLGAYSGDSTYSNVTGAQAIIAVPGTIVAPNQVIVQGFVLPINATSEIEAGVALANINLGPLGKFAGAYPFYVVDQGGVPYGGFLDSNQSGITATISVVQKAGWWWQFELDGGPIATGWYGGNGTFNFNATTAWGTELTPAHATSLGGAEEFGIDIPLIEFNQPMEAFFGNETPYYTTSTLTMDKGGVWGVPYKGLAFQWDTAKDPDVILGSTQDPWLGTGTMIAENATTHTPTALTNGTTVWVSTSLVATAAPSELSSGGESQINVTVSSGGNPVSGATLTATDPLAGTFGTFTAGAAGTYSAWYTAPTVSAKTWDNLTLTATAAGYSAASGKVPVLIQPALTVWDNYASGGTTTSALPGAVLTVGVWTNISGTGVPGEVPFLSVSSADGTFGAITTVGTGYYTVPFTVASVPASSSATISVAVVPNLYSGLNNANGNTLTLNIQETTLSVAALTLTPSAGTVAAVTAGATLELSTDITGLNSAAVTGATVTFSITPAFSGSTTTGTATTTASGWAYWNVTTPSTLTAATTYSATATATATGYKGGSTPSAASFTVEPPSSSTTPPGGSGSSTNGGLLSNPYLLIGIIAVVVVVIAVVVLMMRKKKGTPPSQPQAWSGAAPSGMEGYSGMGPEGQGPDMGSSDSG